MTPTPTLPAVAALIERVRRLREEWEALGRELGFESEERDETERCDNRRQSTSGRTGNGRGG